MRVWIRGEAQLEKDLLHVRLDGALIFEDVFDAATGDYITTDISFERPHLGAEGVDICGPSVAYLLDP